MALKRRFDLCNFFEYRADKAECKAWGSRFPARRQHVAPKVGMPSKIFVSYRRDDSGGERSAIDQ